MFPYIIIGLLLISLPIIYYLSFKKGIRKGMADFLALLLVNGFNSKINAFKKQNPHIKKGGIAFVGDSITQDYNVYDYFSEYTVYNRGIGGDTTQGLLTRLDLSVFDLNPSHVFLLIGTNDFALLDAKPEEVFQRILTITKMIKEKKPQTKIFVQSIYPVNVTMDKNTVYPRNNKDIQKCNQLLKTIECATYIDVYSILVDQNNHLKKEYSVEGLHINEEGYEHITTLLKSYL
ncbi:MAG: lysophospholipase [Tenericutes bacterium HGW-Tenericutes-7]|nr:MAG: lysophospholipase [Tenericutes bacterium HGW-Tenericutes-7]